MSKMGKRGGQMPNEDVINMDVWKDRVQQDINDIKQKQNQQEEKLNTAVSDIHTLQLSDKLQDKEIDSLKSTLNEIKEDTNWIRRKITGAFITALVTAVVAGIVGYAFTKIF